MLFLVALPFYYFPPKAFFFFCSTSQRKIKYYFEETHEQKYSMEQTIDSKNILKYWFMRIIQIICIVYMMRAWWGILLAFFNGEKRHADRLKYTYVQNKTEKYIKEKIKKTF